MLKEVADQFEILRFVHSSIESMLEGLSEEQWLTKPTDEFNNVASIVDHVARVERKFLSALTGEMEQIEAMETLKASSWDVAAIRKAFAEVIPYAESVLSKLTAEDMDAYALKLRAMELNKRQLLTFTITHSTHHRGQIPLVLKLIK